MTNILDETISGNTKIQEKRQSCLHRMPLLSFLS